MWFEGRKKEIYGISNRGISSDSRRVLVINKVREIEGRKGGIKYIKELISEGDRRKIIRLEDDVIDILRKTIRWRGNSIVI